ncbi:MAG: acyltransferase [Chitinophagaceae bacterium]|jgi:maltose O-acetyltransferase|nr:acyltransferase [Chitinophagaceae bacterium]OQY95712.1 MAG: hypothetical protein B6D37_04460 [Sphingobacteriales bacterium UTBCD1]
MIFQRLLGGIYGTCRTAYYQRRYRYFKKLYKIKSNFIFQGTDIRLYGKGSINAGNDSYIGSLSAIQLEEGCKVVIGDHCMISHNVRIYTSTNLADQDFRTGNENLKKKGDVIIGDGVWIGANVFINPGINIGNNSVIGANSVVTKDIPENSICGGVPAKVIRFKKESD